MQLSDVYFWDRPSRGLGSRGDPPRDLESRDIDDSGVAGIIPYTSNIQYH